MINHQQNHLDLPVSATGPDSSKAQHFPRDGLLLHHLDQLLSSGDCRCRYRSPRGTVGRKLRCHGGWVMNKNHLLMNMGWWIWLIRKKNVCLALSLINVGWLFFSKACGKFAVACGKWIMLIITTFMSQWPYLGQSYESMMVDQY